MNVTPAMDGGAPAIAAAAPHATGLAIDPLPLTQRLSSAYRARQKEAP